MYAETKNINLVKKLFEIEGRVIVTSILVYLRE